MSIAPKQGQGRGINLILEVSVWGASLRPERNLGHGHRTLRLDIF
jgi:hypothetical protein